MGLTQELFFPLTLIIFYASCYVVLYIQRKFKINSAHKRPIDKIGMAAHVRVNEGWIGWGEAAKWREEMSKPVTFILNRQHTYDIIN